MNIFFPIPYIKHKCRNAEFFGFCIISFEIWPEDPDEPGNSRYRRFSSKQCREAPLPYLVAAAQQHRCFDKVFRQPIGKSWHLFTQNINMSTGDFCLKWNDHHAAFFTSGTAGYSAINVNIALLCQDQYTKTVCSLYTVL